MKYYHMSPDQYTNASRELWRRQHSIGMPLALISSAFAGEETEVWIQEPTIEAFFRVILTELNIPIKESDERQVETFWGS
jgi:hypothetical protein